MLKVLLPALPGPDGKLEWHELELTHVPGRTLGGYLSDLSLEPEAVSHLIIDGRVIRPADTVKVLLPQNKAAALVRRTLGIDPPCEFLPALEAFIPPEGATFAVVPKVAGKNAPIILGVIGLVLGVVLSPYTGGSSLMLAWHGFQAAMIGYSIGSAIGAMIAPRPKSVDDKAGPSSYIWGGITNDDRPGMPEPILMGERLVGGVRIAAARRRANTVPVRVDATSYTDDHPSTGSEKLSLLVLVAGHPTEGPVGKNDPDAAINLSTNPPDIRIDGRHYKDFDSLIKVDYRTGAPGQTVIPGFEVVANTYDINSDLTTLGAAYNYTTVSDLVDAFEVLLTFPGLSHTGSDGNIKENSTWYTLEYRVNGGGAFTNIDYDSPRRARGNSREALFETRRVTGLTPGRYDIRVTYSSAAFTDATKDQWHIILSGITEESQKALPHPGRSLMSLSGIATEQLGGALPVLSGLWRGAIPQTWDGSAWDTVPWGVGDDAPVGRNTGWLTLWLLTDRDVGAGNEIIRDGKTAADAIDLNRWKEFADECAEMVTVTPVDANGDPAGAEYDEAQFQLDCYIDQQINILDLLKDHILPTARAVPLFSAGKYSVGIDKSETPAQWFNEANIVADADGVSSLEIQYASQRGEQNCFDITYDDGTNDYRSDVVTVAIDNRDLDDGGGVFRTEDDLVSLEITVLRKQMQFFGITRRSQAVREGRYSLRQIYTLRASGGFIAGPDSLLAEAYDVIGIQSDLPQWGYGGFVQSGSTSTIVRMNESVPIGVGTHAIRVRFAAPGIDGKDFYEERTVSAVASSSTHFGLVVTVAFSRVPAYGDKWWFGPVDQLMRPFRIASISREAGERRQVAIADFNESVYDIDGPIVIPEYSQLPDFTAPPPPITSVTATAQIVLQQDGSRVTEILLQWPKPEPSPEYGFYQGAKVEYSYSADGPWNTIQSVDGTEFRWANAPQAETLYFRVTPYSSAHKYNYDGAATTSLSVPWFVTNYNAVTANAPTSDHGQFTFSWVELNKVVEYEIRGANANWGDDIVANGFIWRGRGHQYTLASPSSRSITLYIKAKDAFGNYSTTATAMTMTDAAPSAPTLTGSARTWDGIRVTVTPPVGSDLTALFLHASTSAGFAPDASNRVAQVVSAKGGDFYFLTTNPATYYFRVCAADFLSERFQDWVFATETNEKILHVTTASPTVSNPLVESSGTAKPRIATGFPPSGTVGSGSTTTTVNLAGGGVSMTANAVYEFTITTNGIVSHRTVIGATGTFTSLTMTQALPISPGAGDPWVLVYQGVVAVAQPDWQVTVDWTYTDPATNPANSLIGFECLLYTTDYDHPEHRSALITQPSARRHVFHGITSDAEPHFYGAVRAVYVGGIYGPLVSSTGATLIPGTSQAPPFVTQDAAMTFPYSERFIRSASLPTGITKGSGITAFNIDTATGELSITGNATSNAWLEWDVFAWGTAYLDSKRFGFGAILLRLAIAVGKSGGSISVITDDGNSHTSTKLLSSYGFIDDGQAHNYTLPWGNFFFTGTSTVKIKLSLQNAASGAVLAISGLMIGLQGNGSVLDGDIDRAIQAREQFTKVPADGTTSGGGLNLGVPVVLNSGDFIITNSGIFFTRPGSTLTDGGYRVGTKGRLGPVGHGDFVFFESQGLFPWLIDPPIPDPAGLNRFRILLEKAGATVVNASPAQYPLRAWLEATNLDFQGFLHNSVCFFGGLTGSFRQAGPWTTSQQRSSTIGLVPPGNPYLDLVGSAYRPMTVASGGAVDAWWYGKGQVTDTDANSIYFRAVVTLKIVMPNIRDTHGIPYNWRIVTAVWSGEGNLYSAGGGDTAFELKNGVYSDAVKSDFIMRSDGGTYIIPITITRLGASQAAFTGTTPRIPYPSTDQCFIARLISTNGSTPMGSYDGAVPSTAAPSSIVIDSVYFDFMKKNGAVNPTYTALTGETFSFTSYNEN